MTDLDTSDEIRPANDTVPLDELNQAITEVMVRARYARDWCEANNFDAQASPLVSVLNQIVGHSIIASTEVGEGGFHLDESSRTIAFSAQAMGAVILTASILNPDELSQPLVNRPMGMSILSLYIFHEITHIAQKFTTHKQAQTIKRALGKQFLATIDTRADLKAVHCATIIQCAYGDNFSKNSYVNLLHDNAILAFRSVTDAFSVKDATHKQQRALGLLCTIAICESALNCCIKNARKIYVTAASPLFAGYDPQEKVILCCNLDNGDIVFISQPYNNSTTAEDVWLNIEKTDIFSAKSFLRMSFEEFHEQKIA
ncbi:hypothetical protein [Brevundimonas bullata]|uniref:hypothetical protein n=1 Tax=Brevundimonas bullata TaxID=13160 RepID=UPI0019B845E5|nr:hypothetical protein [Brevundimonas sp.]